MPISINGTGTITGISAGGLPDACVTAADLASGAARTNFGAGCILQVAQGIEASVQNSLNSTTFADIPNITATITPTSTSNKILVMVSLYGGATSNCSVRLVRGSTPIAVNTNSPTGSRIVSSAGDFIQTHKILDLLSVLPSWTAQKQPQRLLIRCSIWYRLVISFVLIQTTMTQTQAMLLGVFRQ